MSEADHVKDTFEWKDLHIQYVFVLHVLHPKDEKKQKKNFAIRKRDREKWQ